MTVLILYKGDEKTKAIFLQNGCVYVKFVHSRKIRINWVSIKSHVTFYKTTFTRSVFKRFGFKASNARAGLEAKGRVRCSVAVGDQIIRNSNSESGRLSLQNKIKSKWTTPLVSEKFLLSVARWPHSAWAFLDRINIFW